MCRKQRFTTIAKAEAELAHIATKKATHAHRLECRAYPCGRCGGWHLTSKELTPEYMAHLIKEGKA